jgi:hypothetical protein
MEVSMNWKKLLKWTGVGGAVIGSAIYAIQKSKDDLPSFSPERIPDALGSLVIHTAREELVILKEKFLSHFEYVCEPTPFKIYSVYESKKGNVADIPIFHVTPNWYLTQLLGRENGTNRFEQEKFYATIWLNYREEKKRRSAHSQIQKGRRIEFRLCNVGGGVGGVETGEAILSPTPVERFEVNPRL